MAKRPGGAMTQGSSLPTRSQLIPILTKWDDLRKRKQQLAPIIFCIVAFFVMDSFGTQSWIVVSFTDASGNPSNPLLWIYSSNFLIMLAIFLTMASLYLIYRLVGKNKSWWILLGCMAFTAYFLWLFQTQNDFGWLYDIFHKDLAGGEANGKMPFISLLLNNILGTGFFEEFVKAIPVLIVAVITPLLTPELRAKFGVEEPLDGILLGAASGGGFAIVETLGQYISGLLANLWFNTGLANHVTQAMLQNPVVLARYLASLSNTQMSQLITEGYNILGTSPGLKQVIIRSIDLAFGHMAFAGYFGYFIGLAVLKPESRWKILGIGWLSAAIPHALWDSLLEGSLNLPPLVAATALLSFGVLAAAILKAREISPNRGLLQPSIIFNPATPAGSFAMAGVAPAAAVPAHYAGPAARAPEGVAAGNQLRIGSKFLVIVSGLRLLDHQVPGLSPATPGGPVAEVTRNPNEPGVLGLTNRSSTAWEVISSNGTQRTIATGQTIKLSPGTRFNFGSTDGEVC